MNNISDSPDDVPKYSFTFAQLEDLIEKQDDEILTILTANPLLMNLVNDTNQTLLHIASKYNNFPVSDYLIEKGCDIDSKDDFGSTPLMIAGKFENDHITGDLVCCKADVFAVNSEGQSALEIYLDNDRDKCPLVVRVIFDKVRSRCKNDEELFKVLKTAKCRLTDLVHLRNIEVTKMYLNMPNYFGEPNTFSVANCMDFDYEENLLRTLLQYGTEQDVKLQERWNCFAFCFDQIIRGFNQWEERETTEEELQRIKMYAQVWIDLGYLYREATLWMDVLFAEITEKALLEILDTDFNSYVKNEFGYEPIAYLFANPNPGIFQIIQKKNIDINLRGKINQTVLHLASLENIVEYVKYLLEKNLDPNAIDNEGQTPIFYCFYKEVNSETNTCVTLLLNNGADIQVCNNNDKTFLEYFDYIENNTDHEKTLKTIVSHLAILQSLKIPIKDPFTNFIKSHETLRDHYTSMREQIDQMKTHNICRSLTLFTALTQTYEFVSHRINNLDFSSLESLENHVSPHLIDYNSQYTDRIHDCLKLAYEIYIMRKDVAVVVYDSIDRLKGYHVVVDKICSYLVYNDLHRIMYPSHELNCDKCKVSIYKRKDTFRYM